LISRKGLLVVICLQRASDKLSVELDSSRRFSSLFDMLQKPAQAGGVKKGLKVFTANGSGTSVKMPLNMFVAIPGWITMSRPQNQWRKRQMTDAPFLQVRTCKN